jgi:3-methyl-2-oxobutanoate hydroxymethyltransferase
VQRAHLVADLPFMSYQASVEDGMRAAGRLMKEGRAEAVKLEGGVEVAELVTRLVRAGIPVMGHVGMTPQSVHQLGGFKIQGRTDDQRARILEDAQALVAAGVYAIVVEAVPRARSRARSRCRPSASAPAPTATGR